MLTLSKEDLSKLIDYINPITVLASLIERMKQLQTAVSQINSTCISSKINAYLDVSTISADLPILRQNHILSKHINILETLNPSALKNIHHLLETEDIQNTIIELLQIQFGTSDIIYQEVLQGKHQDAYLLPFISKELLILLKLDDISNHPPSDYTTLKFYIIRELQSNVELAINRLSDFCYHHYQITVLINNSINTSDLSKELVEILKRNISSLSENIKKIDMLSSRHDVANHFLNNEILQRFYEKLAAENQEIVKIIDLLNETKQKIIDLELKAITILNSNQLIAKENSKEAANLLAILQNFNEILAQSAERQKAINCKHDPLFSMLKPTPKIATTIKKDPQSPVNEVDSVTFNVRVAFWLNPNEPSRSPNTHRRSDLKVSTEALEP